MWLQPENEAQQPIIRTRKYVSVPLKNPNNSPKIYFQYNDEIYNSVTTGIRLVWANTEGETSFANLVNLPNGGVIAPFTIARNYLLYLQRMDDDTKKAELISYRPVIAYAGMNVRMIPKALAPPLHGILTKLVNPLVNKRIDIGSTYVQNIAPDFGTPPDNMYLVFAWDYEHLMK